MKANCPVTATPGNPVPSLTLRSLVQEEFLGPIDGRQWFFCDQPDCDVVYFTTDGSNFTKNALKVRVGVKEKDAPRPVCYCFGHTVESIREEISRTGQSSVAASIAAKIKVGQCRCETANPKGTCCLGDVNAAVKDAFSGMGIRESRSALPTPSAQGSTHGCCAVPSNEPTASVSPMHLEGAGLPAVGGAIVAAMAASACCWLPVVLVSVGASAAGVSAAFERLRPVFAGLALILLGVGFHVGYFRRETCAPGSACEMPNPRLKRVRGLCLWVGTAFVLAFVFFPNYSGLLLRSGISHVPAGLAGPVRSVTLRVEGMSCAGCAAHVQEALAKVSGVRSVTVQYAQKRAIVTIDPSVPLASSVLIGAIEKAGYRAQPEPGT